MIRGQTALILSGRFMQMTCTFGLLVTCLVVTYRSVYLSETDVSKHYSASVTSRLPPSQNKTKSQTKLPQGLSHLKAWLPFNYDRYSDYSPEDLYHTRMNEPNTVVCWDHSRYGNINDGGWDMCIARPYLPKTNDCLIYSFGINNDWSFDDAVSEKFHCQVRAFDPSMENYPNNSRRGDSIDFYHLGLSDSNGMKQFAGNPAYYPVRTLGTLRRYFSEEHKVLDYLKADIEGSEWQALPQMMDEGVIQKYVKQFALEYHGSEKDSDQIHEQIRTLDRLEEVGFRRWLLHWNMNCRILTLTGHDVTYCYEAYYININFIQ